MNYRHAFHAGNHADVLKHIVLLACLAHLKRKDAPFAVLDTHAGAGLYDLTSDAALRSPEFAGGVAKLWDWPDPPALAAAYLDAVRAHNADGALRFYPGSPALAAAALRAGDRLLLCELHEDEVAKLRRNVRAPNVHIHARDGWEALHALIPFKERRGLILVDPPYEAPGELAAGARAVRAALAKFQTAMLIWWRPLKDARALDAADAELFAHNGKDSIRIDLAVAPPALEGPLTASSVLVVNPPHTLAAAMIGIAVPLAARLSHNAALSVRAPD